MAWPTSWSACRLGFPVDSKVNFATDNSSTGACCAHKILNSSKQPSKRSKSDLFAFVATMNLHGCSFIQEGAQRAASIKLAKVSGSTDVAAKARVLRRAVMKGWIGNSEILCLPSRTTGTPESFAINSPRSPLVFTTDLQRGAGVAARGQGCALRVRQSVRCPVFAAEVCLPLRPVRRGLPQ